MAKQPNPYGHLPTAKFVQQAEAAALAAKQLSVALGATGLQQAASVVAAKFRELASFSPQGLRALDQSTSILSQTMGAVLTPALGLMAAGVLTLADFLWSELRPKLPMIAQALGLFAKEAAAAGNQMDGGFWDALKEGAVAVGFVAAQNVRNMAAAADFIRRGPAGDVRIGDHAAAEEAEARKRPGHPGFMGPPEDTIFDKGLRQMAKNLDLLAAAGQAGVGARGGLGGIAEANRRAQAAAFRSPLEQKVLDILLEGLQAWRIMAQEMRRGKPVVQGGRP